MRHLNRQQAKRGLHNHSQLLEIILDDPKALGLEIGTLIRKIDSNDLRINGKETIDLALISQKGQGYLIYLVEVKSGYKEKDRKKAKYQLRRFQAFLRRNWRQWLKDNNIAPLGQPVSLCLLLVFAENEILVRNMCHILGTVGLGTY